MGLDYDYPEREKACATKPLKVRLDGSLCGEIRKVKDGYQYYPKGDKKGGEIFNSVPDVQNSLLAMQPSKADREDTADEKPQGDPSAAELKKSKIALRKANTTIERASVLLQATFELLGKQVGNDTVLNLVKETVTYDETECDGHSLSDDISEFLESL